MFKTNLEIVKFLKTNAKELKIGQKIFYDDKIFKKTHSGFVFIK